MSAAGAACAQILRQGERASSGNATIRIACGYEGRTESPRNWGCDRLEGSRIDLPVKTLLGGIQAVRAHFYAAFHSGRRKRAPLSRERLKGITGLPERTQRAYDHIAQVNRERNMAIGPRYTPISAEEQAWQRGRGMFRFVDSQGQQGAPKREYVAWHLPNSYHRTAQHTLQRGGRKESTGD